MSRNHEVIDLTSSPEPERRSTAPLRISRPAFQNCRAPARTPAAAPPQPKVTYAPEERYITPDTTDDTQASDSDTSVEVVGTTRPSVPVAPPDRKRKRGSNGIGFQQANRRTSAPSVDEDEDEVKGFQIRTHEVQQIAGAKNGEGTEAGVGKAPNKESRSAQTLEPSKTGAQNAKSRGPSTPSVARSQERELVKPDNASLLQASQDWNLKETARRLGKAEKERKFAADRVAGTIDEADDDSAVVAHQAVAKGTRVLKDVKGKTGESVRASRPRAGQSTSVATALKISSVPGRPTNVVATSQGWKVQTPERALSARESSKDSLGITLSGASSNRDPASGQMENVTRQPIDASAFPPPSAVPQAGDGASRHTAPGWTSAVGVPTTAQESIKRKAHHSGLPTTSEMPTKKPRVEGAQPEVSDNPESRTTSSRPTAKQGVTKPAKWSHERHYTQTNSLGNSLAPSSQRGASVSQQTPVQSIESAKTSNGLARASTQERHLDNMRKVFPHGFALTSTIKEAEARDTTHQRSGTTPGVHNRLPQSMNHESTSAAVLVIGRVTQALRNGDRLPTGAAQSNHGVPYTEEEDDLLWKLRQEKVPWPEIPTYFQGRTQASLATRMTALNKRRRQTIEVEPSKQPKKIISPSEARPQRLSLGERATVAALNVADSHLSRIVSLAQPPQRPVSLPKPSDFASVNTVPGKKGHWHPWTPEEDTRLQRLKGELDFPWSQIISQFPGRSLGALQVRWSTNFVRAKDKGVQLPNERSIPVSASRPSLPAHTPNQTEPTISVSASDSPVSGVATPPRKRPMRKTTVGLSYAIKSLAITESPVVYPSVETELGAGEPMDPDIHLQPRRPAPSLDTLLRCRELGERGVRSRNTSKALQDAVERQDLRGLRPVRHLTSVPTIQHLVKNYVFDTLRPVKYQDEFSKDVSTVSWSPNGNMFAAGAVCESDPQSQQYNNPRNLLIGNKNEVRELPEHHVARPVVKSGVNALQSMRECLDPRLFMTVQQVAFSPNSDRLYSAAVDGCVNAYKIRNQNNLESTDSIKLMYKIPHKAAVDFLSISSTGILATGCRYSGRDSIRIVRSRKKGYEQLTTLSPNKITGLATYPSALRWGTGSQFKYLLAGFSCEKEQRYEEDISRDVQGETCLWDVETGARIPMGRSGGAVFDVTWNPVLNCRTAFATATVPNARVNKGTQSVVRLYAPGQGGARASYNMELECPAYDINDVIYCPYDENLVAVGSTDGKAFVWDCRYVDRHQSPQRVLTHGECLSVIPHTKYRWEADTGIRFLSWGENRTRLYTGSSDGVVKCWNPYAADEDMHIKDVASFNSAVMSGSFSPDHAKLLIGTENCRLNLLTVDNQDEAEISMPSLSRFTMHRAFMPANSKEDESVRLQPFLDSGELSLRRMGSLPVRQVVQGPNYTAPGIPTCESHVKRAEAAQAGTSPLKAATLLQEADEVDAEARRERPILRKQAAEFQDALAASLRLSRQQEEQCHLDCAYKPTEDQGYYTLKGDDKHSRSRIPSLLRTERPPATLHAALADSSILQARALRAQLTSPLEAAVLRKQADYLQAFRYVCKECGVLSRTSMCEKCDFKCFRCGNRARVSPRVRVVECEMCGLAWRADVLGYELVREEHREKTKKDVIEVDPVDKEMKKMRDEEMSFYVNSANWGGRVEVDE